MKHRAANKPTATPQKTTVAGKRVFKFPYKRIPVVTSEMWERMETSARTPRKGRHYPVMVEAPDA